METNRVDDTDATNKVIDTTTNCGVAKVAELDEFVAAKNHDSAKGQFVVVGRDVAKGQIAAKEAIWFCCPCSLYSLKKYSAIVAEVKGCFGIEGCNNQLARKVLSCTRSLRI